MIKISVSTQVEILMTEKDSCIIQFLNIILATLFSPFERQMENLPKDKKRKWDEFVASIINSCDPITPINGIIWYSD